MKSDELPEMSPPREPRFYTSLAELQAGGEAARPKGLTSPGGVLPPELPRDGISRRRFLAILSASAAVAVGGSSCSDSKRGKVVPYTRKPPEIVPGVATYYASTFQEGLAACGVLVKTREGRPLHVEGNGEQSLSGALSGAPSGGKAPLRAIADLLGLYDPDRLRQPRLDGEASDWAKALKRVTESLEQSREKPVLVLSGANLSPTRSALIEDLKGVLPGLEHVAWEPAGPDGEMHASKSLHGEWHPARHHFSRATVIVSLQADFLGSEGDPAAIGEFAARRRVKSAEDPMNRLWVLEGAMSLTGANADQRVMVRPSRLAAVAFALAKILHEKHGVPLPDGLSGEELEPGDPPRSDGAGPLEASTLEKLAEDLVRAGKESLVIAGSSLPPEAHAAAALINAMLGAEGHTVDASRTTKPKALVTLEELRGVLEKAGEGSYAAAFFLDVNPAVTFPDREAWKAAIAGIPLKVRLGLRDDETAADADVVLPENHWLESWGDFEVTEGLLTLRQPTIAPLHDTRQAEDVFLEVLGGLGGKGAEDYPTYLKARWETQIWPAASPGAGSAPEKSEEGDAKASVSFEEFWNAALHDGVLGGAAAGKGTTRPPRKPDSAGIKKAIESALTGEPGKLELLLVPSATLYDGRYANNGWLQELPDPVTKMTWGNALAVSPADAGELEIGDGDLVRIEAGSSKLEVPVVIQPGQAPGVLSLALGHGQEKGSVATGVGCNASRLADPSSAGPLLRRDVRVEALGKSVALSRTQEHHRMEGRDIVRSWTLEELDEKLHEDHHGHELHSLSPEMEFPEHKWEMAIDLSACVGCSACTVACQSENNIPVVGPEQVRTGREMHWIRVDRYYEGEPEDPRVVHQPLPCQHCDHAPCEIVCPVNATTHSPDGLNQMTYNRCVGTRYCANNCPYKVRRFNYFDYTATRKEPESLVFNPEVSVRPRGVMEKCTFCVQRIQDAVHRAKSEERPVRDGEIRPACAVACPADAIVFGDRNDPESAVSRLAESHRAYRLLEELGARPSVTYLARITNPAERKEP